MTLCIILELKRLVLGIFIMEMEDFEEMRTQSLAVLIIAKVHVLTTSMAEFLRHLVLSLFNVASNLAFLLQSL